MFVEIQESHEKANQKHTFKEPRGETGICHIRTTSTNYLTSNFLNPNVYLGKDKG
jgi:hypothetical protein